MEFEWDSKKAQKNLVSHGVTFEEATSVFEDGLFLIFGDPDHSDDEKRFIIVGESTTGRLLVVAYTERRRAIRIISARKATRKEKSVYAEEV